MFNESFYPTPAHVGRMMLQGINLDDIHYVLDPSAGKGDLLDLLPRKKRYAIEINPDLRAILHDKGHAVIAHDFLSYGNEHISFDLILMNPPFRNGVEHLLKAWSVLIDGQIVCLLNTASLDGSTEREKLLLNIIEASGGKVEHLGNVFSNAERTTNVQVSMVRLAKTPSESRFKFTPHNNPAHNPDMGDAPVTDLARGGYAQMLVDSFDAALRAYEELARARSKMFHYLTPLTRHEYEREKLIADLRYKGYNSFVEELQAQAWNTILDDPRFDAIMTNRARDEMKRFKTDQERLDFNMDNIHDMFMILRNNQMKFLYDAVGDVFDYMTAYYNENRVHVEGWKSNECWKVAPKVVLPHLVNGDYSISYHSEARVKDIDRAVCLVTGLKYNDCLTVYAMIDQWRKRARQPFGNNPHTTSTFFDVRFYKKGTLHLKWLDDSVRERFNQVAAQGKGWLPPAKV